MDALRSLRACIRSSEHADAGPWSRSRRALVLFAVQRASTRSAPAARSPNPALVFHRVETLVRELRRPRLRAVINATGVILHTTSDEPAGGRAAQARRQHASLSTWSSTRTGRRGRATTWWPTAGLVRGWCEESPGGVDHRAQARPAQLADERLDPVRRAPDSAIVPLVRSSSRARWTANEPAPDRGPRPGPASRRARGPDARSAGNGAHPSSDPTAKGGKRRSNRATGR